jgi:hypothetical protein
VQQEHICYWWKSQKERSRWEDQDVGGCTILRWILEREGCGGVNRIDLAQDSDQRKPLVNAVLNCQVPQNAGKFYRWTTSNGINKSNRSIHWAECNI